MIGNRRSFLSTVAVAGVVAVAAPLAPQTRYDPVPSYAGASLFRVPDLERRRRDALTRLAAGDQAGAEQRLRALVASVPGDGDLHATLAEAFAVMGRHADAIQALERAVGLGVRDAADLLAKPVFAPLRDDPRFTGIAAAAASRPAAMADPVPAVVGPDQQALVSLANSHWKPQEGAIESRFVFAPVLRRRPVRPIDRRTPAETAALANSLNRLHARGLAAGNIGDLYDNRDGGHSTLMPNAYPQLGFVRYGPDAQAAGRHWGFARDVAFDAITIGNSSTAIGSGVLWRSQARFGLTEPGGVEALAHQYRTNRLYVYPEHRDHDPDRGDLLPANTPYMLISQGSSGSDRPFLDALATILAALRPDTKAFLREHGLIAPTLQMVLRKSLRPVTTRADYLSSLAHPTAFRSEDLDLGRMIDLANGLLPDEVPPAARIAVVAETVEQGLGPAGDGVSERVFDTPSAVARVAQAVGGPWRYRLTAAATVDPNGRPITFHWRVLRGDTAAIDLRPLDATASTVEVTIPWHEARPIPGSPELTSTRVDIAVFADNGAHLSAPAFLSVVFPPDQRRVYGADGHLLSADHRDPNLAMRYADPLLFPRRDWQDTFVRDADGRLLGWTRSRSGGQTTFTRHGARVRSRDRLGRPLCAVRIGYRPAPGPDGRVELREVESDQYLVYRYDNESDRFGKAMADDCASARSFD